MNINPINLVNKTGNQYLANKKGQGIPSFKMRLQVSADADDLLRTLLAMDCIKTPKPLDLWKGKIVKYNNIIDSVKKNILNIGDFNKAMTIDVSPKARALLKNPRSIHETFKEEKFVIYEGLPGQKKSEQTCLFDFNLDDAGFATRLQDMITQIAKAKK